MTEAELQRIESELKIALPVDYRELMKHYPFPEDSFTAEYLLCNDADFLIKSNSQSRVTSAHHFEIGTDGGELSYHIDLAAEDCPVYEYDLENGTLTVRASDLKDWVAECWTSEDEIKKDEEAENEPPDAQADTRAKLWWQFWK